MDPFIIAAIRYFLKRGIQHLTLFATNKCNIRCRICFVDFSRAEAERDISIDEIKGIRNVLGRIPILNIGGGEPFLREDLADIVSIFSDSSTIGIPTNGWHTEKIIKGLGNIFKYVKVEQVGLMISVDGFERTHYYIRLQGSYERAIKTLEEVRKTFPELLIQVNTVLCKYNYSEILELMDFVKQFKPAHHSIFFLRGNPKDANCSLPSFEDIRGLIPRILKKMEGYNYHRKGIFLSIARNYHKYLFDISLRMLEEKKQIMPCLAGSAALVVYSNGEVSPCELLPPVGNIRPEGLDSVIRSLSFKHSLDKIKNKKCYCTHNCNMTENILFNPQNYMRLLGLKMGGY